MKIEIEIAPDQMDKWVSADLRRCYIDHKKYFSFEANSEQLSDALLTVIEHYTAYNEYEEWYETIKDL